MRWLYKREDTKVYCEMLIFYVCEQRHGNTGLFERKGRKGSKDAKAGRIPFASLRPLRL